MESVEVESFPAIRSVGNRLRIVALIAVAIVLYIIAWIVTGLIFGIGLVVLLVRFAEDAIFNEVGAVLVVAALVVPPPIACVVSIVRIPTRRKALNDRLERDIAAVGRRDPDAELTNLVAGLAIAAGIPAPEVTVLDLDAPNACALGTRPGNTRLVVTRGLSGALTRAQLEAVLAWEMVCIASRDVALTTWATAYTADAIEVLDTYDESEGPTTWKTQAKGFLLGPRRATVRFEAMVLKGAARRRDGLAVRYTRNPQALLEAFEVLQRNGAEIPCASRLTAALWLEVPQQPFTRTEPDRRLGVSLQLAPRIAALRAMASGASA